MAFRRFHHINTSSFDAGVSQKIRQLCYILFQVVKADRKQVPEVMRKNLLRIHTRRPKNENSPFSATSAAFAVLMAYFSAMLFLYAITVSFVTVFSLGRYR